MHSLLFFREEYAILGIENPYRRCYHAEKKGLSGTYLNTKATCPKTGHMTQSRRQRVSQITAPFVLHDERQSDTAESIHRQDGVTICYCRTDLLVMNFKRREPAHSWLPFRYTLAPKLLIFSEAQTVPVPEVHPHLSDRSELLHRRHCTVASPSGQWFAGSVFYNLKTLPLFSTRVLCTP